MSLLSAHDRVVLVGLKDETLSGQVGTVLRLDTITGLYAVKVGIRQVAVKPANLMTRQKQFKKSSRLRRYGNACWRPECRFVHDDEGARVAHWASHWRSLHSCHVCVENASCGLVNHDDVAMDTVHCDGLSNNHSTLAIQSSAALFPEIANELQQRTEDAQIRLKSSEQQLHGIQKQLDELGKRVDSLDDGFPGDCFCISEK